jgi:hypothetical protein
MNIKVIVCCEESQAITIAFRNLGIECYSNDIKPCTGGYPQWHIQGDAFEAIKIHDFKLMVAHPPCTHIAVSGSSHFREKYHDGRLQAGIDLFKRFTQVDIPHWCIENPVSIMSTQYRKPDQIINPYFFGDKAQKTTCLWLKNLPKLYHQEKPDLFSQEITHVDKGEFVTLGNGKIVQTWMSNASGDRSTIRSKTFKGIAEAIATQYTDYLKFKYADKTLSGNDNKPS